MLLKPLPSHHQATTGLRDAPAANTSNVVVHVVYITGAGSGIGLSCARRFAADGYTVVGSDVKPTPPADFPRGASWHQCDVTDEARQAAVASEILATHHRIDVLVTAAGIAAGGAVHTTSLEQWRRVHTVNLEGTFLSCRAVLPGMVAAGCGSIVTIASVQGLEVSNEGAAAYGASKAGVIMLTKNIATECGATPCIDPTPDSYIADDPGTAQCTGSTGNWMMIR
jgi:meso-butanediol dehydrogenase/(S,S)-butanediol dehydrogenase/diacetyl reductase